MVEHTPQEWQQELHEYVFRMAYLAEMIEWDNRRHLERMRRYCEVIARGLGLPPEEVELLSVAAQLHDLGKASTPEVLLKKADNYEDLELLVIQRHTIVGARVLEDSRSPYLAMGRTIALTHHERWDGSGYPAGLAGLDIPLGGRICALADVYDALATRRSYKPTLGLEDALKVILDSAGVLFDPELVQVFEVHFAEITRITLETLE